MNDDAKAAAEQELTRYRHAMDGRDDMVRRAHATGITKRRIHALSGIARTTINRILIQAEEK